MLIEHLAAVEVIAFVGSFTESTPVPEQTDANTGLKDVGCVKRLISKVREDHTRQASINKLERTAESTMVHSSLDSRMRQKFDLR